METQVLGLREQRLQGHQRVDGLPRGQQVVVVDEDVDVRPFPPRPVTQLLRRHVGTGHASLEEAGQLGDLPGGVLANRDVSQKMLGGELAQQGAPQVDGQQTDLARRAPAAQLVAQGAQERGLPGLGIAQDDEVRVVAHVEAHGLQARLVDPDDRGAARRHLLLKRRQVDARGQQTQLGPLRTGPRLRDRTTGVVGAAGQRRGVMIVVGARQRQQHVPCPGVETAPGPAGRNLARDLPVDLGVRRVAQPQLDAGGEHVLDGHAHVGPSPRGDDDVHAQGQGARRDRHNAGGDVLEVRLEGRPSIDDEEDVAVPVVETARGPLMAVGLDRVDAIGLEEALAIVQQRRHLGHDPGDDVGLVTGGDAGQVRQVEHGRERPAPQVDDVDLHLHRGARQRQTHDQGAQRRRFPAERTADDGDMPAGPRQVDAVVLTALLQGDVGDAQGHLQVAAGAPGRRHQAQLRIHHKIAQQRVEGLTDVQGRQPDLMRGRAVPGHPRHGDVHRRHLGVLDVLSRRRRARLRLRRPGIDGVADVDDIDVLLDGWRRRPVVDRARRERNDPGGDDPLAGLPGGRRRERRVDALRRLAGDVAGPEAGHLARTALEVAAARVGRQVVGVRDPQDDARLGGGEGAQADPVGQMGLQAVEPALLQALGGQQQVDLHRAPQAPDGDEHLDEVRLVRQQLRELVEDDEQGGQRLPVVLARASRLLVVGDVGVVARVAQHLLAAGHLPAQSLLHAVDEAQLALQVRDHGGHVGKLRHARECGAALEVDQHEVELIGRVGQRQRQDQRAQDLGLAGTGGAHEQAVGAHAVLSGLLDVQHHGGALRRDREGDPEPLPPRPPSPVGVRVEVAHITQIEQGEQIRRALRVGRAHGGVDRGLPGGGEAR